MPRIAAVDFGLKRIGLAISDEKGMIALPLKMVAGGKSHAESAKNVLAALSSYTIDTVVVGMPLHMSGKKSEMATFVEQFIEALKKICSHKIETMDERLSTAQAERDLKEMNYSRKSRTQMIDSASAVLMLQAYLERKNHEPS